MIDIHDQNLKGGGGSGGSEFYLSQWRKQDHPQPCCLQTEQARYANTTITGQWHLQIFLLDDVWGVLSNSLKKG